MSAPCATRPPSEVFEAYSSSTWFGSRSPVSPAKRYTSDSLTVFENRVLRPTGTSSMVRRPVMGSPPVAARGEAAIHEDSLPGDETCGVGGEERHDVRHVLRLAQPAQRRVRDRRLNALGVLVHICLGQRRPDHARSHGV